MMNKEQLETIKKGYQWWLEAENQADKNEFAECITTEDVPALIAEVERLREFEVFVKMYYTQFLKERSENESRRLTANTQLGFYVKANDLLGEPNGLPLKEGDSDE